MQKLSIFDIAGPIMVGPSSSHTAGACKIGQFARALFHHTPLKVTFYLSGSFGQVYKGHATDRALLAGVMKMRTSDPGIKESFRIADEKHLKYKFIVKELGPKYHPNTVQIVLENHNPKNKMSVIGSSVGGGMVEIVKINNFDVLLKGVAGRYQSLVICHDKDPELLNELIFCIKKLGFEIMNTENANYKNQTLSILSIERQNGKGITLSQVLDLEKISRVEFVRALSKLDK